MTEHLKNLCWSLSTLEEGIEELALKTGLLDKRLDARAHSAALASEESMSEDSDTLGRWIETTAEWMGLEAEPLAIAYAEIEHVLRLAGPFIIRLPVEGSANFLAIASGNKKNVNVIAPDGNIHRVKLAVVHDLICQQVDAPFANTFDQLLEEANVSRKRRQRARSALLGEALASFQIENCWMLRLPPGASFLKQLRLAHLPRRFSTLMLLQFIQYVLLLCSWWVVGRGALQGRFDRSWLLAWMLLLFTMIPFRVMITWLQGIIAISAGGLLKQRLLYGALRLAPDTTRKEGSGKLLGRVIESAAVEALSTSGGFAVMAAVVEILMTVFVLSKGAGGLLHALIFICWAAISLLIGWRYFKQRDDWTDIRLLMTNDMVERMVGHRTRLAQEAREHWHDGEDQLLTRYIDVSRSTDRSSVLLMGMIPRGWLLLGLAGLAPSIASGDTSTGSLAISIGGLLLGYQALGRFSGSLSQMAGAVIAWKQVKGLFNAASRSEIKTSPVTYGEISPHSDQPDERLKLIECADLVYKYRQDGEPVLQHCSLEIFYGERILLEGASGEGKSTLASLLVGLRMPSSGLLLLEGFDYQTLGARGWRERVTAAPQFHENHVLAGTLAFNLLMGRGWPPSISDLEEAQVVCCELGLRGLLERMPSGLSQIIGETGWQLSHGERSRLFIARALLQKADLIVLDESFAALDPENLRRALECAFNRSRTLVVVAHP
jgi:ATP-binding cassette subfamily B protein